MPRDRTQTLHASVSPERIVDRMSERVMDYFSHGERAAERLGNRIGEHIGVERFGESIGGAIVHGLGLGGGASVSGGVGA